MGERALKIAQINTADLSLFKKNLFKKNEMNDCPTCRKGSPLKELKCDTFQLFK